MAVTTTNVVIMMQGDANSIAIPNDGWIFYGYDTRRTLIEDLITRTTRYIELAIDEGIAITYPNMVDDLILYSVCLRIVANHMGLELQTTGFGFDILQFKIDGKFGADLMNIIPMWQNRVSELLLILLDNTGTVAMDDFSVDYQNIMSNNGYSGTATWFP